MLEDVVLTWLQCWEKYKRDKSEAMINHHVYTANIVN